MHQPGRQGLRRPAEPCPAAARPGRQGSDSHASSSTVTLAGLRSPMGCALVVVAEQVQVMLKAKTLLRHSNALKPALTPPHRMKRMQECLRFLKHAPRASMLRQGTISPGVPPTYALPEGESQAGESTLAFDPGYDLVVTDEKWFCLLQATKCLYLLRGDAIPYRAVRHKKHILKVMFFAAWSRPRWDHNGDWWPGKIGIGH